MVVDFFNNKELKDILKFEFVFSSKKTGLDEFEGKVREIPINEKPTISKNRKFSLDEGIFDFIILLIDRSTC